MTISQGGNNRLNEQPKDKWLRRQWQQVHGAGKGDTRRPVDNAKYAEGYARIFGHCDEHPAYNAEAAPNHDCIVCRRLWRETQFRRAAEELERDRRVAGEADCPSGSKGGSVGMSHNEPAQSTGSDVAPVVLPNEPDNS